MPTSRRVGALLAARRWGAAAADPAAATRPMHRVRKLFHRAPACPWLEPVCPCCRASPSCQEDDPASVERSAARSASREVELRSQQLERRRPPSPNGASDAAGRHLFRSARSPAHAAPAADDRSRPRAIADSEPGRGDEIKHAIEKLMDEYGAIRRDVTSRGAGEHGADVLRDTRQRVRQRGTSGTVYFRPTDARDARAASL